MCQFCHFMTKMEFNNGFQEKRQFLITSLIRRNVNPFVHPHPAPVVNDLLFRKTEGQTEGLLSQGITSPLWYNWTLHMCRHSIINCAPQALPSFMHCETDGTNQLIGQANVTKDRC
jgi:hypothetical protein